jgi:hypothetical protein
MYGVGKPVIFTEHFLPSWHGSLVEHSPTAFENMLISSLTGGDKVLGSGEKLVLLEADHPAVIAEGEDQGRAAKKLEINVHDSDTHGSARTWDQLHANEQRAWKEKLHDAGAWTQNMGESVFKGVLFGELAGVVGRVVAG